MVNRKKRTSISILWDILNVVRNGAKKTAIMNKANLSYELTEKYLNRLIDGGLVIKKDDTYVITNKGKELLEKIVTLRKKQEEIKQIIRDINKYFSDGTELVREDSITLRGSISRRTEKKATA
ncbi:hypothetical protein HS7_10710 [Sulfolobales archaeon HS-7]|nr:hypothetical protein HS7_10710 [Sulfolobales archaeon HS-7]